MLNLKSYAENCEKMLDNHPFFAVFLFIIGFIALLPLILSAALSYYTIFVINEMYVGLYEGFLRLRHNILEGEYL